MFASKLTIFLVVVCLAAVAVTAQEGMEARMREVEAKAEEYRRRAEEAEKEVERHRSSSEEMEKRAVAAESEANTLLEKTKGLERDVQENKDKLASIESQLEQSQQQYDQHKGAAMESQQQEQNLREKLEVVERELRESRAALDHAQTNAQAASSELMQMKSQQSGEKDSLEQKVREMEDNKITLQGNLDRVAQEKAALEADLKAVHDRAESEAHRVNDLAQQRESLQKDLERASMKLKAQAEELQEQRSQHGEILSKLSQTQSGLAYQLQSALDMIQYSLIVTAETADRTYSEKIDHRLDHVTSVVMDLTKEQVQSLKSLMPSTLPAQNAVQQGTGFVASVFGFLRTVVRKDVPGAGWVTGQIVGNLPHASGPEQARQVDEFAKFFLVWVPVTLIVLHSVMRPVMSLDAVGCAGVVQYWLFWLLLSCAAGAWFTDSTAFCFPSDLFGTVVGSYIWAVACSLQFLVVLVSIIGVLKERDLFSIVLVVCAYTCYWAWMRHVWDALVAQESYECSALTAKSFRWIFISCLLVSYLTPSFSQMPLFGLRRSEKSRYAV